jgi:hypothetical protein
MPDSSRGSFQSIAEPRGPSIEPTVPDNTNPASTTTTAVVPLRQETLTPTSGSRAAPEGSGSSREKVWIPRVSHRSGPLIRARTKHACEACRKRRIKCDGARPLCQGCSVAGVECSYADHKRVRDRQEMKSLKTTIGQYEHLLRDLLREVPAGAAKRIQSTLTVRAPMPLCQVSSKKTNTSNFNISMIISQRTLTL